MRCPVVLKGIEPYRLTHSSIFQLQSSACMLLLICSLTTIHSTPLTVSLSTSVFVPSSAPQDESIINPITTIKSLRTGCSSLFIVLIKPLICHAHTFTIGIEHPRTIKAGLQSSGVEGSESVCGAGDVVLVVFSLIFHFKVSLVVHRHPVQRTRGIFG